MLFDENNCDDLKIREKSKELELIKPISELSLELGKCRNRANQE